MDRIHLHPFVATLIVVALLIIGGAALVVSRSPAVPSQNSLTWGGGTPISAYQSAAAQQSPQQIAQDVIQNRPSATLSLPPLAAASSTSSDTAQSSEGSTDYLALLVQLSGNARPSTPASQTSANAAIGAAYQFIPTGLVATTAPAKKPMTADQQSLYDYGNSVGAEIQSFEELNSNEAQILKDQAEDRTSQAKANAVISLGQGFAAIGTYMNKLQEVPASVSPLNSALAQSYLDIGAKLQVVAQAQSDSAFVQAVENYDTTADTFVRNYGALAQFFQEQGVAFSPQDPGSVFSFTDTGGAGGL